MSDSNHSPDTSVGLAEHPLCYELIISIPEEKKPSLIELLLFMGEESFVEGSIDCDNLDFDYDNWNQDFYKELAIDVPVVLYSEDLAHLQQVILDVANHAEQFGFAATDVKTQLKPIADQNWRESWKASFKPLDIEGVFCILPPWENKDLFPQPFKIVIDPGMAFGTGQHETTRICLQLYLKYPDAKKILDVGTGSGILGIAARLFGASKVVGNDIDKESVLIAQENAEKNNADNVFFTDLPIEKIDDNEFDLAFANIQIKPLSKIFPDIVERVKNHGIILISGILESEEDEFLSYLKTCNVTILSVDKLGHWLGITCQKN